MSRILKVLNQLEQDRSECISAAESDQVCLEVDADGARSQSIRRFRTGPLRWSIITVVAVITVAMAWYAAFRLPYRSNTILEDRVPIPDLPPAAGSLERAGGVETDSHLPGQVGDTTESEVAALSDTSPSDTKSAYDARDGKIDFSTLERVDRRKIRLQALVWSPVAAERKAVINEEIVWEGEIVEGLTIVAINIDEVILSRNGLLFRAVMGP